MGAWGYGVRQDDFVCDVIGVFEDLLKAGKSVREATETVKSRFAVNDADEDSLLWIALADVQWTYGALDSHILDRVKEDLETGRSLTLWTDDPRGLSRRRAALETFIRKIDQSNPRPKRLSKTVVRAPKFPAGTCLSIRLSNGQYAAALVLVADASSGEYGRNLIGLLDYLSPDEPTLDVFRMRKWRVARDPGESSALDIAWYYYMGFRAVKNRLAIVGTVEILGSDPKDSNSYRRWTGIGEHTIHRR